MRSLSLEHKMQSGSNVTTSEHTDGDECEVVFENPIAAPLEIEHEAPQGEEELPMVEDRCVYSLYTQYLAVGIVSTGLPATLYGFFLGYLNVNSYVYATAGQAIFIPWSCKVLFGVLNDRVPIRGYRRKPYMALGWFVCALALFSLATQPMPEAGDADAAGSIAAWMCLATLGYVIADVAADGLLAEIAKREQKHARGTVQTNVYLVRAIGGVISSVMVGFGMNGKQYSGTFDRSMSFSDVCFVLATVSLCMIPVALFVVFETKKQSNSYYFSSCYSTLCKKCMFYIVLYSLLHTSLGNINTTADGFVMKEWAGVHNLQAQISNIVGNCIFIVGLIIVKRYMRQMNWRTVIAQSTVLLALIDALFTYLTVYDIVRNQYFYLGETVVTMVPAAVRFMVTSFLVVEVAPDGQEGMMYSLLTMLQNLGGPFSRAISNQIFALFDGLSTQSNYVADTASFRNTVALSYGLSYGCSVGALVLLPLIPRQQDETKHRLQHWAHSKWYGRLSIVLIVTAWVYSVTLILLALVPKYSCLQIVGGSGC